MPRKEKSNGSGHKDFEIFVDPFIGYKEAALRRDFTINSLMKDVLSGEIIDSFNGIEDLNNKIIRHVNDESFCEDPLRVFRGAQFAARFDFEIDEKQNYYLLLWMYHPLHLKEFLMSLKKHY